jgi:hypothetical protein
MERLAAVPRFQRPESLVPEHTGHDAPQDVIILRNENRRGALATLRSIGHIQPCALRAGQEKISDPEMNTSKK